MTEVKHVLHAKGAAFEASGEVSGFTGSTGEGRAKCSCGWLSGVLPSGRARKLAHTDHKFDSSILDHPYEPELASVKEDEQIVIEDHLGAEEPSVATEDDLLEDLPKAKKPVDIQKMKNRINALLAKAESSTFPEERDLFNAGAEKLMLRLGISIAELESDGKIKTDPIVEVQRVYPGNYSISMIPFANAVARGFGNITLLQAKTAGLSRVAYLIGHKSDVEQFCNLLDSLALQVVHALRTWQKENIESRRGLTDMQKYLQHRSFIEGFGSKVGLRLGERRTVEEHNASTGAALVLASKESRIKDWMTETYGDSVKADKSSRRHSSIGFHAGRSAGETANLGEGEIKS